MNKRTPRALCALLCLMLLLGASALADEQTLSLQAIKDEAMAQVQEATALEHELLRKGRENDLKPRFLDGNAAYSEGRYEDALLAFDAYLGAYPRDWQAYNNRALAAMQLGYFRDALEDAMVAFWIGDVERPEALINLLVAGHGLGFGADTLLHAMRADTRSDLEGPLSQIYPDEDAQKALLDAIAFNVAYVQMEKDGLQRGGPGSASLYDLLNSAPMAGDVQALIESLPRDEDRDQLMDYFQALVETR